MILLNVVAYVFISKINERYGNSYRKAKWTVGGYLLVFSASFFVRGTSDVLNQVYEESYILNSPGYLIFFYTSTEFTPLFVLYVMHIS